MAATYRALMAAPTSRGCAGRALALPFRSWRLTAPKDARLRWRSCSIRSGYRDSLIGHSGVSKWARRYLDANPEVEVKLQRATQNIEPKMRFYRPTSVKVDQEGKVYVVDC